MKDNVTSPGPVTYSECETKQERDFGWALSHLRNDKPLARHGWNGKGMAIALQRPDIHSKMNLPYIFMVTAQGQKVPWLASQSDILANDWYITF